MEDIKLFLQKNIPALTIHTITFKEGDEHKVAEINNSLILRFAKTTQIQDHMAVEIQLLRQLVNKISACAIPQVAYYFPEDHCFGYLKIPGVPLTKELYASLSHVQKQKLAQDVAQFLYELHASMSVTEAHNIGLVNTDWPLTPDQLINNLKISDDSLIQKIFDQFIKRYAYLAKSQKHFTVVHNDLHADNILINPDTKLSGIIDFTSAAIGNAYHEFRYLHLISKELLILTLQSYNQKIGEKLNVQDAYTYSLATEFSRLYEANQKKDAQKINTIKQRIERLSHITY